MSRNLLFSKGKKSSSAIKQRALHLHIYSRIKRDIVNFSVKPGHKLTEMALSKNFGVSRTPVREALRMLNHEGLVVAVPRSGYFVREFDLKEMDMWYEVRMALEALSIDLAAKNYNPEVVGQLSAFWFDRPRNLTNIGPDEYVRRDEEFHESLAAMGGNTILHRFLREINERIRIIRRLDFTDPTRIAMTYDQHSTILRLFQEGRSEKARECLQEHIRESRDAVKALAKERLAKIYL